MLLRHALLTLIALIASRNSAAENLYFVTEEFPPFSYSRGATASGALPDIVEATCRTLQWQCHIEVLPCRRALQQAGRRGADGRWQVHPLHGTGDVQCAPDAAACNSSQ